MRKGQLEVDNLLNMKLYLKAKSAPPWLGVIPMNPFDVAAYCISVVLLPAVLALNFSFGSH